MKYFEFGQEHSELMVMLHGGGVSYLGMLPTAKKLAERYHVVLVAYDGFNPGEPETEFVSPMDEARRLGDYVVEHYGGKIDILYGISYGCRVLMEVLADKRLTVTTTIADGMGLRDYPNIKSKWGKDVYCFFFTGLFYAVMGHPGPRRKRFLAKISGRTLEEAHPLRQGDVEKLAESGPLPDRQEDGLLAVCQDGHAPLVRHQGERGQKAVEKPRRAESKRVSLCREDIHRPGPRRSCGRASRAV